MARTKVSNNLMVRFYHSINGSKLFLGLAMIILNLFSKYVVVDLSKSQEAFLRNTLTREILIFIMAFVGTRDLIVALSITATFIILSSTAFNEQSKFCIIPEKYKQLHGEVDTNKDGYISDKEIERAKSILKKANIYNI
tara:strand:- start:979 stop:1395 length:417 start_codon:yes stop_codon:yes gene_type:complete